MLLLVSDTPMGSGPGWAKKEGPPKAAKRISQAHISTSEGLRARPQEK